MENKYDDLKFTGENGFKLISDNERCEVFAFSDEYAKYLKKAKTEREACSISVKLAEEAGFVPLCKMKTLSPGDRVYEINRGKGIILAVIGNKPYRFGLNAVGAHLDVPRIDLKQNPLFEDNGLVYFKTHYYGGIKKYQWTTIPLAIHGVIIKKNGDTVDINIGENENDPVFCITDLLPHLAGDQMKKSMREAITGEGLNVLIGNIPLKDKEKEPAKTAILKLLNEKYGITEEDFISSELEVVPAINPRDIGFDRSMLAGYGQDDRVCCYTALRAIMDIKECEKTSICMLVDKEEVGSMGNTGMQSRFFENTVMKICEISGQRSDGYALAEILTNSVCISADVGAAFDPNYPEVMEKRNAAFINNGCLITKYTGSRGKAGASDASAELVGRVRRIFGDNAVLWQTGELGKVDLGGGGTIAQFVANLNMDVIDVGVPLFSMHSPFEVAGKLDIFMTYKGYRVLMENM